MRRYVLRWTDNPNNMGGRTQYYQTYEGAMLAFRKHQFRNNTVCLIKRDLHASSIVTTTLVNSYRGEYLFNRSPRFLYFTAYADKLKEANLLRR